MTPPNQKESSETERIRGHIKWLDRRQRIGFIRRDDALRDVFLHMSELRSATDVYQTGDEVPVEFEIRQTPGGSRAVNVVVLETE